MHLIAKKMLMPQYAKNPPMGTWQIVIFPLPIGLFLPELTFPLPIGSHDLGILRSVCPPCILFSFSMPCAKVLFPVPYAGNFSPCLVWANFSHALCKRFFLCPVRAILFCVVQHKKCTPVRWHTFEMKICGLHPKNKHWCNILYDIMPYEN